MDTIYRLIYDWGEVTYEPVKMWTVKGKTYADCIKIIKTDVDTTEIKVYGVSLDSLGKSRFREYQKITE